MNPAQDSYWEDLFAAAPAGAAGSRVTIRVVRRGGRPFLLLPRNAACARATLELYAAQTLKARVAKAVLALSLWAPFPPRLQAVSFAPDPGDPYNQFLARLAGRASKEFPEIGVLAGNPASPGQRFLVLVFGKTQEPLAVVKTGVKAEAREFVRRERVFLAAAGTRPELPKILREIVTDRAEALAMPFYRGHSPRRSDFGAIPALLESWIWTNKTLAIEAAAGWERLDGVTAPDPLWTVLRKRLAGAQFHPALHHGDFAPWNVKVSAKGLWTVLDWERGELRGIPGWDWFHYVLQEAILVQRLSTAALVTKTRELLASSEFRHYAQRAGIVETAEDLLLAYLLHSIHVIRPAEGLQASELLLTAFAREQSLVS